MVGSPLGERLPSWWHHANRAKQDERSTSIAGNNGKWQDVSGAKLIRAKGGMSIHVRAKRLLGNPGSQLLRQCVGSPQRSTRGAGDTENGRGLIIVTAMRVVPQAETSAFARPGRLDFAAAALLIQLSLPLRASYAESARPHWPSPNFQGARRPKPPPARFTGIKERKKSDM